MRTWRKVKGKRDAYYSVRYDYGELVGGKHVVFATVRTLDTLHEKCGWYFWSAQARPPYVEHRNTANAPVETLAEAKRQVEEYWRETQRAREKAS